MKLNLWQKFCLKVWGSTFVGHEIRQGWSEPNKIYAVNCLVHGLYSGPRHGWGNDVPQCPKCIEEIRAKDLLLKQ